MRRDCEAHLKRVQDRVRRDVAAKYRAGQAEHGGQLWRTPEEDLLKEARNEVLDLVVYLTTLLEQRERRGRRGR